MNNAFNVKSIWIISKYAISKEYGFESRHFALAREFEKMGVLTTIISSDSTHFGSFPKFRNKYNFEKIDNIDVCWIKTLKYKKTTSIQRILSWIDFEIKLLFMPVKRFQKPNVIIVSSLSLLTIFNGYILSKRFKCKLVFEVRDIWPLTLTEEGGFSRYNPFIVGLGIVERFGYRKSDLIVGTMPNLSEHVKNVIGKRLRCICIPFGFDPDFFKNNEIYLDTNLENRIKNKFVVGYAGSLGISNGLDTIIACAKKLSNDPNILFFFLGDGDFREKYINDTAMLNNVIFIPKVKRTQVQSVLKYCDILYLATLKSPVWKYGMSLNKLIDYMMSEKPIIASYSGYPSMINEAACGEFVEAENIEVLVNKINEYAQKKPDIIDEIGKRGRQWLIKNRTWEKVAKDYLYQCNLLFKRNH